MDFVPIVIAGQTYRLRFTGSDLQDICRYLTRFQPPGNPAVSPPAFGQLLVNYNPDAYQAAFWKGLSHIRELKDIDLAGAQKLIDKGLATGQQYRDWRVPVFKALIACGLADFKTVLTLLEEEDEREAQADAEIGQENPLTRPSTTPSSLAESVSSI